MGPIPIIVTIDPHANLSPAMVAATDAVIACRTNPHVDQRERGMATTARMAPFSLGQIRHAGLDPASFTHLVAKGVPAPMAACAEVCPSFVRVDPPGVTSADPTRLAYRRSRPLHPFEEEPGPQPHAFFPGRKTF